MRKRDSVPNTHLLVDKVAQSDTARVKNFPSNGGKISWDLKHVYIQNLEKEEKFYTI